MSPQNPEPQQHDSSPADTPAPEALRSDASSSETRASTTGGRRTHPLTPLIAGWKIIAGIVAVIFAQNISQLMREVTVMRVLVALGLLVLAVVVGVALSALSWWFTRYEITEDGVTLRRGMISTSQRFAPREKIESVSVERPFLARLVGLAKVRVEIVGGSESHLDIEYVSSADAEQIRRTILQVAHGTQDAPTPTKQTVADGAETTPGADGEHDAAGAAQSAAAGDRVRAILHDGVTDGELIAQIPTARVIHSMLRDLSLWIGVGVAVIIGIGVVVGAILSDGWSFAALLALVPALIAGPQQAFKRLEAGWGFVSRDTERGLRMRRGLLSTRTDNIAPGRIQELSLKRPVLWRGPGWTTATVELAGTEDDDQNGAESILPVGTQEELGRTLSHLMAPLGTDDDLATLDHLLTARARDIHGLRAAHPVHWIARRFTVVVPLPEAIVVRQGILDRRLVVVPRERIQTVELQDGPLHRRVDSAEISVSVAGTTTELPLLPRADAARLYAELSHDAATRRRYRDQARWPKPLARTAAVGVADAAVPELDPAAGGHS